MFRHTQCSVLAPRAPPSWGWRLGKWEVPQGGVFDQDNKLSHLSRTLIALSVFQLVRVPKKVTVKDILQKYKDSVSTSEPEKAK